MPHKTSSESSLHQEFVNNSFLVPWRNAPEWSFLWILRPKYFVMKRRWGKTILGSKRSLFSTSLGKFAKKRPHFQGQAVRLLKIKHPWPRLNMDFDFRIRRPGSGGPIQTYQCFKKVLRSRIVLLRLRDGKMMRRTYKTSPHKTSPRQNVSIQNVSVTKRLRNKTSPVT
jgi:hypothetical protein